MCLFFLNLIFVFTLLALFSLISLCRFSVTQVMIILQAYKKQLDFLKFLEDISPHIHDTYSFLQWKCTMEHYQSWMIGLRRAWPIIIEAACKHLKVASIQRRTFNVLQEAQRTITEDD